MKHFADLSEDARYHPVWVEPDGSRWTNEPQGDGCDGKVRRTEPADLETALIELEQLRQNPLCLAQYADYVSYDGSRTRQLCSDCFEKQVKPGCRVIYEEYQTYR